MNIFNLLMSVLATRPEYLSWNTSGWFQHGLKPCAVVVPEVIILMAFSIESLIPQNIYISSLIVIWLILGVWCDYQLFFPAWRSSKALFQKK